MLIAGLLLGYAVGAVLAVALDRLYTRAPWRGPWRPCATIPWAYVWAGAVGYALARLRARRSTGDCALPARWWYLPLVGAGAGALLLTRAQDTRHLALASVFGVVLLAFVGTDYERHLLPNRLMYPTLAVALALGWAWPERDWLSSIAGGGLGLLIMGVLFLLPLGFGFGDVKLAALLGLLVGVEQVLPALFLAVLAAGLAAAVMLITRRVRWRSAIAYGPYLALGAFLMMIAE